METTGERVRHARKRLGWTQADLAREAGVSVITVKRLELGKAEPFPSTTRKLAEALRVRVEWLTVGEPPMLDTGG